MLRSGISFPFPTFYRHFATLKDLPFDFPTLHHHWGYSPKSSFLNFLPFYHRWCYAPRSSPRYGRHGWHLVSHMVSWGTIKSDHPTSKLEKKRLSSKTAFFKMPTLPCISTSTQPLAATRVAASGCKWPLQASGRKWPQVAAPSEWPLQASGRSKRVAASGRKWPLPASGRKWPLPASGRKWPLSAISISTLKATSLYKWDKSSQTSFRF